jgi:hypothetical protein
MSLILQRLGKSSLGMAKKLGLLALSDSIKVVIAKKYCRGLQLVSGKTELKIFRDAGRYARQSGGAKETGADLYRRFVAARPAPATMLNGTDFHRFGVVCGMVYQGV